MSQYMALYRKWRPAVFSDVVGQDHITKVLRSEIAQGSVSHAYLFCGSRGTGKTTCAKILAKAVSCENPIDGDPCGVCEKCKSFDTSFDIVEMDAASNNGVDNVRELKEKINFMPVEMKRRVYIIDEVHMLSAGAFNALLKTLEEPPEHAMFILATTELNKIPATILSRCKRFDFHRISAEDITKRLEYIAEKENIGIEKDALRLIATLATGAMRDALSMLELFVGAKGVTRETAEKSLGVVGNETVLRLLRCIAEKNSKSALETVAQSYNSSKDPAILCSELGNMIRSLLIMKYARASADMLIDETKDVMDTLWDIEESFTSERLLYCIDIIENTTARLAKSGLSRRTVLEIMVMRLCDSRLSSSPEAMLERIAALEAAPRAAVSVSEKPAKQEGEKPSESKEKKEAVLEDAPPFDFDEVPLPQEPPAQAQVQNAGISEVSERSIPDSKSQNSTSEMIAFGDILEEIKSQSVMVYSLICNAKGYLDGDIMTVKTDAMALYMIEANAQMKQTVTEAASKILGYPITLNLVSSDSDNKPDSDFPSFL